MAAEIVKPEQRHIDELISGIRQADRDEAWSLAHITAERGLIHSLRFSDEAWVGVDDGQVVCVFGVGRMSLLGGNADVWMIGHSRLEQHARVFARMSRPIVEKMAARYGSISNWVDARNIKAIRWLSWLGFEIHPAAPHGIDGSPFHYFEMNSCAC